MDTKELMFGDYVLIQGKRKMWDDGKDFFLTKEDKDAIEPMPFPWDFIENWGFTPDEISPDYMTNGKLSIVPNFEDIIKKEIAPRYLVVYCQDDSYWDSQSIIIRYMHEFQHIIKIWGFELKLNPKVA